MVTWQSIEAAATRLGPSLYESPLVHSRTLSRLTGNNIFLKLENLQMTGSFKERGALNRILLMTDEERQRGVIAASAGNHAQGVAYHAAQRGIPVQIWMPRSTPLVKWSATRAHGADVVLQRQLR
ncbi:MAG: pyridoxal-phosphate dependent enzyme [Nitrospiraceae bacterium]